MTPRDEATEKRLSLYLWYGGDCQVITRNRDGSLCVCGGDDLPESFFDDALDGVTVFDGTIVDPSELTVEQLDEMGIPETAKNYGEWWHGNMREATDAEILAVLGNSEVTP